MEVGFDLAILYRGSLESCNYACTYCPFAKAEDTAQTLADDERALWRFVAWARQAPRSLGILLTPWGEAMVRPYYQRAFVELSGLPQVNRVAAQTNLSYPLKWLREVDRRSAALWCSYHPSQTSRAHFLGQAQELRAMGVRHSVGMVGLKDDFAEMGSLREALPSDTYLWINAYKRERGYYSRSDLEFLRRIDPLFDLNNRHHQSFGKACFAGERAITVDELGTVRRCHFIEEPLGNLYTDNLEAMLRPRSCTNGTCHCHIGYVHLKDLALYERFGAGLLERIAIR